MPRDRILVVEDHADTRSLIVYQLEEAGFEVQTAQDGFEGLEQTRAFKPDLVLLDIMLTGIDGLEVLRRLKKAATTTETPVILLTAKGEEVDRVVGLELGAEDYMVKPFSPRELVLRIKALLRRSGAAAAAVGIETWRRAGLIVNFAAHELEVDGERQVLTATEFKILKELVTNQGRAISRDRLLETVWGPHYEGFSRTVDTHMRHLRIKLGQYAGWIETIRAVGYRFKA